jgi:1-acyl-sn-glycerol-3-phosphate acyltransferase
MANGRVVPIEQGRRAERPRCAARNADGKLCRNLADETGYCRRHHDTGREAQETTPTAFQLWLADVLAFSRRRLTGDYPIDDFGFDRDLTENVLLPIFRPLFERWFRVDQVGVENIPAAGPALLVSNHSGTVPMDALMMKYGVYEATGRHVRLLAADLVFTLPVVSEIGRKSGNTLACEEDSTRLLRAGEALGVFPEGFKGIGKPFRERYKLRRFGRGGFVEVALRTGAPIIPVSIVGAEEIYPIVADIKPLARLLGFPYFPITPFFPALGLLGAIPLPSKWIIEYGEPIETAGFDAEAANDPMFVFNLTDQVRDAIQQTLYRNLMHRRGVFF